MPLFEKTLELMIAKLGADHPFTLVAMNNLASGYQTVGKMDKALLLQEETFRLHTAKHGAHHPETLTAMGNTRFGLQGRREDGQGVAPV